MNPKVLKTMRIISLVLGTITINGNAVTRNPAYYILAYASKFARPGSVRDHHLIRMCLTERLSVASCANVYC